MRGLQVKARKWRWQGSDSDREISPELESTVSAQKRETKNNMEEDGGGGGARKTWGEMKAMVSESL